MNVALLGRLVVVCRHERSEIDHELFVSDARAFAGGRGAHARGRFGDYFARSFFAFVPAARRRRSFFVAVSLLAEVSGSTRAVLPPQHVLALQVLKFVSN